MLIKVQQNYEINVELVLNPLELKKKFCFKNPLRFFGKGQFKWVGRQTAKNKQYFYLDFII